MALHGYGERQAIASGAQRAEIEVFLQMFGLHRYFSQARIIGHEDVASPKPDPEGMLKARASMAVPDGDTRPILVFEDDPKGFEAARFAGMWTIGLTTRFTEEELMSYEVKPDLVVPDMRHARTALGL